MKRYSKYIKYVIKYLILVVLLYNTTDKILRNMQIISDFKKCDAIIVDFRTVPDFFHFKYVELVEVDYYNNERWYKTGELCMDEKDKHPVRYGFHEYEGWMKKGDKIKIWVSKDDQYKLHYINFKSMIFWTIISVGYSIFIVVDIIVKIKRKKLTS